VEETVQTQAQSTDEAAVQSVHDRSVIDHLVATFHSAGEDSAPRSEERRAVYDLIRTEWPQSLTLGTRC
jgi:hypothetical protein